MSEATSLRDRLNEIVNDPDAVQAVLLCVGDDIQRKGSTLLQENGPHDRRGAALWDAGCYLIEHP